MHFATHGFFLAASNSETETNEPPQETQPLTTSQQQRLTFEENPLLRGGLAMAGVNTSWFYGQPTPPEVVDGVLLTRDILGLDLIDTELVVLSACHTGEGEFQVGEGVMGLQRAFIIAGAKTLVMSLWEVDDESTGIFMTEFYRQLFEPNQTKAGAFRAAQALVRSRWSNPYYWGAFIFVGDPGPLWHFEATAHDAFD